MDSKNFGHLLSDDFSDLFNEPDMEMETDDPEELLSTYVKILEEEVCIQKRFEIVRNLAKVVPKTSIFVIDKKVFQYLLPAAKDLVINIFKEIPEIVSNSHKNDKETLKILHEYLQMCIEIHEVLNEIMDYVIENRPVTLSQIESLPSNVLPILLITFHHCKTSDTVYKNYFENLKEILALFKASQDVHTKLLKLLENHITFNLLLDNEVLLLKNVLDILGEIGEVLMDMNLKALADNWKSYMNLTQNFGEVLNENSFDISKPLSFLSVEISRNLRLALNMDVSDEKTSVQSLKICNFFIRVAVKLCETFWSSLERISVNVFGFLSSMYNFFPPFLQFKGCKEHIIAQINSTIFVCSEQLLNKILCEPGFFKVASEINLKEMQSPGFLFLFLSIFQRIHTVTTPSNCNLYPIIDQFFEIVKKSYSEFFWKLKIPKGDENRSLYDEIVINVSLTVLSLNSKEFNQIQLILFKNILQDHIWGALLATDIWCLILRKNSPRLSYETLLQTFEKTQPILLNNYTIRPEKIFLVNFMQRIYMNLPEEYKSNLVEKYSPVNNLHLWKILTFKNFPEKHLFVIESFLINVIEKIELLLKRRCDLTDFNFLCNGLEAISTLSEDKIDLNYLQTVIVKAWNFKPPDGLSKNFMFNIFIQKLCQATLNFLNCLDNDRLAVILPNLNQLLKNNFNVKIQAIQILRVLSSKTFEHSPEKNKIFTNLSEIFQNLLKSENPIIQEASLELFVDFLNTTPHEIIVQEAVQKEDAVRKQISNYIQRCVQNEGKITSDEYYSYQKNYKYKHVCPEIQTKVDGFVLNKTKINKNEVDVIIKRIKNDVIFLHKLFDKTNVSEENANEIVGLLKGQVDYKI